jgi:hypothetical protein
MKKEYAYTERGAMALMQVQSGALPVMHMPWTVTLTRSTRRSCGALALDCSFN